MESLVKHQYDLIVVGLGISGLWLSFLASSQNLKVLGLDKNPKSCYLMTASNGSTRRYHPTKGHDLVSALKMYDEMQQKAHQNGFGQNMSLYQKQKMTYIMDEIKGDYLKTVAQETSSEDIRHHYPRFAVSDLNKCMMNKNDSGLFYCDRVTDFLRFLSIQQGCDFHYNKHVTKFAKNFVVTIDGDTHTSDHVAVCTNGEGYYDKFGLSTLLVRSATIEGDCAGLPEMFTDYTKEGIGFYGNRIGELLDSYSIASTQYKTDEQIQEYLNKRIPGTKIQELYEYLDLRKDNEQVTICEKDSDGLYHLYSPPYRLAPLYAQQLLDQISQERNQRYSNASDASKL